MPGLLIKNVPPQLARKLKALAAQHQRSMTKEALVLLENAVDTATVPKEWPAPFKGKLPMTAAVVNRGKRLGRS